MKKQAVLDLLQEMPDEIDAEELFHRLYVLRRIEIAEAEIEAGNFIPQKEVDQLSEAWLT